MRDRGEYEEEILTSREARELLKIGRTKLWELTVQAEIPAYRIGEGKTSSLRYKKSELLTWLEKNRIRSIKSRKRILQDGMLAEFHREGEA